MIKMMVAEKGSEKIMSFVKCSIMLQKENLSNIKGENCMIFKGLHSSTKKPFFLYNRMIIYIFDKLLSGN